MVGSQGLKKQMYSLGKQDDITRSHLGKGVLSAQNSRIHDPGLRQERQPRVRPSPGKDPIANQGGEPLGCPLQSILSSALTPLY